MLLIVKASLKETSRTAAEIAKLTPPQAEVLASGILDTGFNCILQMPTGSGKTWLAEKIIGDTCRQGYRALYLSPLRALAEELFERWQTSFPEKYTVGIFTGDYGEGSRKNRYPVSYKDAQILLMTPERLDLITRNWRHHWEWLPSVDVVVVDEIHLLGERMRGARLEGAISRLRRLNPFTRIIGLSATLGNSGELADWLGGVEYCSTWRPVLLSWKTCKYRKATEKPAMLIETVKEATESKGHSLIFVQSRRRAESLCRELKENGFLAGHHHAGLTRKERTKTENDFRNGKLQALVTTSTLEMGINLPARRVVLYDLQEFNGTEYSPLSVNTVRQRAGRAGRYGIDDQGEVVLFASNWDRANINYEKENLDPILSVLNDPKMLNEQILAEVGSGLARTEEQLKYAFAGSLAAFQNRLPHIAPPVAKLIKAGMLIRVNTDTEEPDQPNRAGKISSHLRVTPLGRIGVRHLLFPATILLFRKALSENIEFAFFDLLLLCAASEDCGQQLPVDYEELLSLGDFLTSENSALLRCSAEEIFAILGINGKRLLSALKTALALRYWTKIGDITKVSEVCNCYPFEIERLAGQTTRLLQAMREIIMLDRDDEKSVELPDPYKFEKSPPLPEKIEALLRMIECGVDEQLVTLTLIKGIGAITARRLSLIGCRDIEDLAGLEAQSLAQEKGISLKRASNWIESARAMQKSFSAFYFCEEKQLSLAQEKESPKNKFYSFPAEIDPYRLRRALELKVSGEGGIYRVTGGLEPHLVRYEAGKLLCDCIDASKNNLCKHQMAVKLLRGDTLLKKLAARLITPDQDSQLDLLELWMSNG